MALGGMGATPLALDALERAQLGVTPDAAWPEALAQAAAAEVQPHDDPHASADYRRDLVARAAGAGAGRCPGGAR